MLRTLKLGTLFLAENAGLTEVVFQSRWRRQRFLILCYHGISLDDEHEWSPALFLPPALFRQRMQALRDLGCAVLPLAAALQRLDAGTLPERAVAITFDDGGSDFYRVAWPILREFGFPVTVYLTTYYTRCNRPVFDVMLSYLQWKGRGREPVPALDGNLSAREKDAVLASLAGRLGIDYEQLCAKRILHLMTLKEVGELASAGVDFQLHTHRHRTPGERQFFVREIEENRQCIASVSSAPAAHFCYPSGRYLPEFRDYLRDAGIKSATTCEPGLVERSTDRYRLPRLLDTSSMTALEFRAWLSGLAAWFPRR